MKYLLFFSRDAEPVVETVLIRIIFELGISALTHQCSRLWIKTFGTFVSRSIFYDWKKKLWKVSKTWVRYFRNSSNLPEKMGWEWTSGVSKTSSVRFRLSEYWCRLRTAESRSRGNIFSVPSSSCSGPRFDVFLPRLYLVDGFHWSGDHFLAPRGSSESRGLKEKTNCRRYTRVCAAISVVQTEFRGSNRGIALSDKDDLHKSSRLRVFVDFVIFHIFFLPVFVKFLQK